MDFPLVILIEGRHLLADMIDQRFQRNPRRWITYVKYRVTVGFKEFSQGAHGSPSTRDAVQYHDIIFIWSGFGQSATFMELF